MEISKITKDAHNGTSHVTVKVDNIGIQILEFETDPNVITVIQDDCDVPICMHILKRDQGMSYMPTVTFAKCLDSDEKVTISDK